MPNELKDRIAELVQEFVNSTGGTILDDDLYNFADLVHSGLEDTMGPAYHRLRELRADHKVDLRTAAFIEAINKIAICYQDLGIFP